MGLAFRSLHPALQTLLRQDRNGAVGTKEKREPERGPSCPAWAASTAIAKRSEAFKLGPWEGYTEEIDPPNQSVPSLLRIPAAASPVASRALAAPAPPSSPSSRPSASLFTS